MNVRRTALDLLCRAENENRFVNLSLTYAFEEGATEEDSVYAPYYDYREKLDKIPSHRVLAVNRGEKEEFLKVSVEVDAAILLNYLFNSVIENIKSPAARYVTEAIADSYDRLIAPSIEREIRSDLFDNACEGAIRLFSDNLKHLLMQSPLKGKTVMGFDPGYVNGCKTAVVDKTIGLVFITELHDTRFDEFSVLRPLDSAY